MLYFDILLEPHASKKALLSGKLFPTIYRNFCRSSFGNPSGEISFIGFYDVRPS